jgi:2-C-methyl-D-erythritol 4-phosphate cytidylyltransferase/2-C-methyl-D-erythritol 2,4-cyclodiphosphate synthase
LRWTAEALAAHPSIDGLLVVTGAGDVAHCREILSGLPKLLSIVSGGATRQESVAVGLYALGGEATDWILVHDGARPLISASVLDRCLTAAHSHGSAVAALPFADTLKRSDAGGIVTETVDREGLWAVQTPQIFRAETLFQAHSAAAAVGFQGTDEASLVEKFGSEPIHLVPGSADNLKITRPEDLTLAEALLNARTPPLSAYTRVGFGYDIHRLVPGRRLVLGGVEIAHTHGLEGHSDADVLIHALMDALLGAAALPDIGHLFPNTDPAYAGADSTGLLAHVARRVAEAGYQIINVDLTLIAEAPKIAPYVQTMQEVIAQRLSVSVTQVGIKATTHEGLGALGRGAGIAAHAVAALAPSR